MHLRDSDHDAQFRAEVRAWLAEAVPTMPPAPDPTDWPARRAHDTTWQLSLIHI